MSELPTKDPPAKSTPVEAAQAALEKAAKETRAKATELAHSLESSATDAAEVLEETAHDAADVLGKKAQRAMTTLERSVVTANQALSGPEGADLAALLPATDLPELPQNGALGSLGVRLDREADLYRNVALRELGRVAWIDRVTMTVVVLAFVGEAALAGAAGFSAIVGATEGRGGLFALAAVILGGSAAGVAALVASSRRMHRDLASHALERSRSIEDRIAELAITMAWREAEGPLVQEGLARLEGRWGRAAAED